ncbi:MAG: PAS domain S-box protein [Bacteroidota bacterium]
MAEVQNDSSKIKKLEQELEKALNELNKKDKLLFNQKLEYETLNQELLTINEELNASNEELLAVNDELKRNEEALLQSEANIKTLLNSTLQFFYLIDVNHRIIAYNELVRRHFKNFLGREIQVGDDFLDYLDQLSIPEFLEEFKEVLNGKTKSGLKTVRVQNGPKIHIKYSYVPIKNEIGAIDRVCINTLNVTDEIEAKKEQAESQRIINSVFKTTDVGLCIMNEEGFVVKVNPKYAEIYAISVEELQGQHFSIVYSLNEAQRSAEAYEKFITGDIQSETDEKPFTRRDGKLIHIYITSEKMQLADGVQLTLVTVRDITETRNTQRLLEDTQGQFKIGGWEYDLETQTSSCTNQVFDIYEVSHDYVFTPENVLKFFPIEEHQKRVEQLRDCVTQFRSFEFEIPFISAKKNLKRVRLRFSPVVVEGRTVKVFGTIQDITVDWKNRLKTKESQERFKNLFQYAGDSIFLIDKEDFSIVDCNISALEDLGYEKAEILKKNIKEITPDPSRMMVSLKETIVQGQSLFEGENLTKTGDIFPVEVNARVVSTNGKEMIQAFVRDISERKRAESEIRSSEERFRKVFSASPLGMTILDLEGNFVEVNDRLCNILGYTKQEYYNLNYRDVIYNENTEEDERLVKSLIENELPHIEYEKRYIHKNGSVVWIKITATMIRDEKGAPLYGMSMIEDITDKRKAQILLRESEERFRKIFDQSPIGISIISPEGYYLDANEQMAKIIGYKREEILSKNYVDATHPEDKSKDARLTKKVFDGEVPYFSLIKRYIRKDGKLIWAKLTGTVIRNEEGTPIYGLGMIEDITKTKEAEEKLRQSEERFEKLATISPVGIFSTDREGNTTYINKQWSKITGLDMEKASGSNWSTALHPDDKKRVFEEWMNAVNEDVEFSSEFRFQRPDGKVTWVLTQATKKENEDGETIGYIGSVTDIDGRIQAEADLHRSNYELQKINSELDRFVYSASHDLRSPLVSILGLINLSFHKEDDPEKIELLEMMKKSVKKLDDFIQDIIYYSRNARLDVKKEKVKALEIIEDCLENYGFIDGYDEIEKKIEVPSDLLITTDPGRLKIILNNLISNSIRFRRPGEQRPYIRIAVKSSLKNLRISVGDNGIGIDKNHIGKVFNMFYRAREEKVGSGLGLFIVKETVDKLDGEITVESKAGAWTKFNIKIPNEI